MKDKSMRIIEEKLKKFFQEYEVNQINCDTIKKEFQDAHIKSKTNYTLLHFVADYNYPTDKAIAMVNDLLKLKVDPNIIDTYSEYSFVHLALYSKYPLKFFKGILPTAIEYGLDVNIKDGDGDSIIHSAIYSEDYFDEISPFFDLLGPNFDIHIVNKKKESIKDALNIALEEAKKGKNIKWQEKLVKEKEKICFLLSNQNNESIAKELNEEKRKKEEEQRKKEEEEQRKKEEEEKRKKEEEEKRKKEEEQRKYQNFLNNFKEKLKNISSIYEIPELLELSNQIKDSKLREEVVTELKEKNQRYQEFISTAKESFDRLTQFGKLDTNNKNIQTKIHQIQRKYENGEISIRNIEQTIREIQETINTEIDNIVLYTVETIQDSLKSLETFKEITNRNLEGEVKKAVKFGNNLEEEKPVKFNKKKNFRKKR